MIQATDRRAGRNTSCNSAERSISITICPDATLEQAHRRMKKAENIRCTLDFESARRITIKNGSCHLNLPVRHHTSIHNKQGIATPKDKDSADRIWHKHAKITSCHRGYLTRTSAQRTVLEMFTQKFGHKRFIILWSNITWRLSLLPCGRVPPSKALFNALNVPWLSI